MVKVGSEVSARIIDEGITICATIWKAMQRTSERKSGRCMMKVSWEEGSVRVELDILIF